MKSMKIIVALLTLWMSPTWGASIGLFADPGCSSCNLQIPPGGSGTFYVRAQTQALYWHGEEISGAEFKIEGLPAAWTAAVVPLPGATTVGNPFGPRGANIAFIPPRSGGCVLLYTVTLTASTPGEPAQLHVTNATPPSSPNWPCPLVAGPDLCDFCIACVDGGLLYVNSPGDCVIAVEPSTWSRIKSLFQ